MERKNLANCTPIEFLRQTSRLRKAVEKWLNAIGFAEIRSRIPDLSQYDTKEAKAAAIRKQGMDNVLEILDKALDECPDVTLEVLALTCFVEPDQVNTHPMSYYLASIGDMIGDEGVISFFISLNRLGQTNTSDLSKA